MSSPGQIHEQKGEHGATQKLNPTLPSATQATAALGRVVIDLAEFAAIDNQETRAFMVSCNKHIHAAVGEPQLLITIR
jgi:hypothetical protein